MNEYDIDGINMCSMVTALPYELLYEVICCQRWEGRQLYS